jgi:peptide chain release factor subunit 1
LVELRIPLRARKSAHVNERPDLRLAKTFDELLRGPPTVSNREQPHTHRIAASPAREAGMAATVSWDGLRDLASFRAEKGCAISVYVDLDPSVSATAADIATRINSVLDTAEKRAGAEHNELSHGQREALQKDFQRLRRYFEDEFDRDGAHGAAVFCAGLDNFWRPLALSDAVPDEVKVGPDFYLSPLVPLVGRGEGALVVAVGRERGEIFRLRAARLEEIVDQRDSTPGRHDQGGWSQARYQRHIDELAQRHLRHVAEHLERQFRERHFPRIVVVCSEETRPEFEETLANDVRQAVIGWTTAEAHASPAELLEIVTPVLEQWRAAQEEEAVERWREEAGRNGRASSGWAATLEAASDARVDQLLFQDGADRPAWQCPACGRVAAEGGACPLDGTRMDEREDGLDLAVHQTLAHGGTVWAVTHRRDLDPVEGIGALLRY